MSKEVGVIILGTLTVLSPFMGLPADWRTILVVLLGLATVALGFYLRSETLSRDGTTSASFFIDNRHTIPPQASASPSEPPQTRIQ